VVRVSLERVRFESALPDDLQQLIASLQPV